MSSIVVVGTQWGDEGKGKITDFLAEQADVIARLSLIHISEPTRREWLSRMPSSA